MQIPSRQGSSLLPKCKLLTNNEERTSQSDQGAKLMRALTREKWYKLFLHPAEGC